VSQGAAPHARWFKAAFIIWALAVFTGTHWPQLKVPEVVTRTDLVLHMGAFAPWTILLSLCAFFGPRWSLANIGTSAIVALAYAALDESTQAVPILGRTAGLDDFGADCAGVLLGALLLLIASHTLPHRERKFSI
jgi:VanZ family protein